VGEVWEQLKKEYPGKATLIIVSDHGFSPIEHQVLPNVALKQSGLIEATGDKVTGGQVRMVTQGGAALVYVKDEVADRQAVIEKMVKAFAGLDGVEQVVTPADYKKFGMPDPQVDPHSPDLLLFAKEGWNFGDTAGGDVTFVDKPERKGSHGHDAALPDLHATFIAWGEGIRPGARLGEVSNVDVAPTIAKLLGIPMPDADGKPIAGALAP
jgi:predicted AlkP superfamily pyrophosphatase or phosphodiesterase